MPIANGAWRPSGEPAQSLAMLTRRHGNSGRGVGSSTSFGSTASPLETLPISDPAPRYLRTDPIAIAGATVPC